MRRIALLSPVGTPATREAMARTALVASRFGIETATFRRSEDMMEYAPDCVLAFSGQDAKLTPFPTYGVLVPPVLEYSRTRRFVRNVLTYDACLTMSDSIRRWVTDLAFGSRKFSCPIGRFAPTVQATAFAASTKTPHLAYVGSIPESRRVLPVLESLRQHERIDLRGPRGAWDCLPGYVAKADVPFDGESILAVYREAGIGLDLTEYAKGHDGLPSTRLLEIVAASAAAIVLRHPSIEQIFGDTLFYVDADGGPRHVVQQIRAHAAWIAAHRGPAAERARAAHAIMSTGYAMDRMFPALLELHNRVKVEKGYAPDPDPQYEASLPSATYIMRTGGGRPMELVRRALDSAVAQQYPKLKVLMVLFRPMPELEQLRREYPQLGLESVDDLGGLRSTAIVAGMRHVTTDYFGLLDDDDVLSPNHVRMLVKALQYHSGRNWRGRVAMAYSGSVEVGDTKPRAEHAEYEDEYALPRRERRVMEHYRLYSSTEMSQHRWYLINSWLARRDLVDDELLNDPRIHTCEDLYVALQIAQRTHLAFSGEVTMNHCYRDVSSTIVDAGRHLPDTQRGAIRHFTRLLPTESGHGGRLMPLGQPAAAVRPPAPGTDLTRHLLRVNERIRGAVELDGDEPVVTEPVTLTAGLYQITVRLDLADEAQDAHLHDAAFEVGVTFDEYPAANVVSRHEVRTLGWTGSLRAADLNVVVPARAAARIALKGLSGPRLVVRHLLLTPRGATLPLEDLEMAQVG